MNFIFDIKKIFFLTVVISDFICFALQSMPPFSQNSSIKKKNLVKRKPTVQVQWEKNMYELTGESAKTIDNFFAKEKLDKQQKILLKDIKISVKKKAKDFERTYPHKQKNKIKLNISYKANKLKVSSDDAIYLRLEDTLELDIDSQSKDKIFLFLKSKEKTSPIFFNQESKQLEARSLGSCELLITAYDQLISIFIFVNEEKTRSVELAEEKTFINRLDIHQSLDTKRQEDKKLKPSQFKQGEKSLQEVQFKLSYQSQINGSGLYPASRLKLEILGLDKSLWTDQLGTTTRVALPKGSSFIVKISDPQKRFTTQVAEFYLTEQEQEENKLIKLRVIEADSYQEIRALSSKNKRVKNGASLCLAMSEENRKQLSHEEKNGWEVELNGSRELSEESKPFGLNFSPLGVLKLSQEKFNFEDRICFFDLAEDLYSVDLKKDGKLIWSRPLALSNFHHQELVLSPLNLFSLKTNLLVMPGGSELLYYGRGELKAPSFYDFDLLSNLGERFQSIEQTNVFARDNVAFFNNQALFYVMGESLETSIYQKGLEEKNDLEVFNTPLFPRGFVSELAETYNMKLDPFKGAALIEHIFAKDEPKQKLNFILKDISGNDYEDYEEHKMIFLDPQNKKLVSAFFINLSRGLYNLAIYDEKNKWLKNKTFYVEEAMSEEVAGSLTYLETYF